MDKKPTTDRNDVSEPLAAPLVLSTGETLQIAGGLAATVSSITGRCCLTCGIGALGPYEAAKV
jgi:hypothetical protein